MRLARRTPGARPHAGRPSGFLLLRPVYNTPARPLLLRLRLGDSATASHAVSSPLLHLTLESTRRDATRSTRGANQCHCVASPLLSRCLLCSSVLCPPPAAPSAERGVQRSLVSILSTCRMCSIPFHSIILLRSIPLHSSPFPRGVRAGCRAAARGGEARERGACARELGGTRRLSQ